MAEFTKGEWKVSHPINNDYTIYVGEYGKGIEQIAILFENKPNVEANAHLIASAPAMYEALKTIRNEGTRCLEICQQDRPVRAIYNIDEVDRIARQALLLAEGK